MKSSSLIIVAYVVLLSVVVRAAEKIDVFSEALETNDESKKLALLYFGSASDDLKSLMALGHRYKYGRGVEKSCETALAYYERAADLVVDETKRGRRYEALNARRRVSAYTDLWRNSERKKNAEVVSFYVNSADQGDVVSTVLLGEIFFHGAKSVERDFTTAMNYFTKALKVRLSFY